MTLPDREQLMTPKSKEVKVNGFTEELRRNIDEVLPQLKKGINILLEGANSHFQTRENVLRGHVCGRAVRVLGYFLRQRGYDAEGLETHLLGDWYPAANHALIVVNDPDGKVPVIVDASFQQFVRIFYLNDSKLPQEEVLVVSQDEIDQKAEEFARLRRDKIESHPNPEILEKHMIFGLSEEEMVAYFKKIWTLELYEPIERKLENDIETYKRDPQAVSELTSKLIKGLKLA